MDGYQENFYVITGGPGVGKTTLIQALANQGFAIVPEDARKIIKQQVAEGGHGLPWKDPELYLQLMWAAALKSYEDLQQSSSSQYYFFDRGLLDSICYAKMSGLTISTEMENTLKNYRYNPTVFILPHWPEIYHTDHERRQTWQEALVTFEQMKATYLQYGYEVIEVPKTSVEERASFILKHVLMPTNSLKLRT